MEPTFDILDVTIKLTKIPFWAHGIAFARYKFPWITWIFFVLSLQSNRTHLWEEVMVFFFASKLTLIDQIPQELKVNSSSRKIVFVINQEAHCYNHVEMLSPYWGGLMWGEGGRENNNRNQILYHCWAVIKNRNRPPVVIRATLRLSEHRNVIKFLPWKGYLLHIQLCKKEIAYQKLNTF